MRRFKAVVVAVAVALVFLLLSNIQSKNTKSPEQIRIEVLEARLDVCAKALEIIADNKVLSGSKSDLRSMSSSYYQFGPYETPSAAEKAWRILKQKIAY